MLFPQELQREALMRLGIRQIPAFPSPKKELKKREREKSRLLTNKLSGSNIKVPAACAKYWNLISLESTLWHFSLSSLLHFFFIKNWYCKFVHFRCPSTYSAVILFQREILSSPIAKEKVVLSSLIEPRHPPYSSGLFLSIGQQLGCCPVPSYPSMLCCHYSTISRVDLRICWTNERICAKISSEYIRGWLGLRLWGYSLLWPCSWQWDWHSLSDRANPAW